MRGGDAEHIARADGDGGEERAAAHKIAAAALHGKRRAQLQRGEALRGEGLLRHGDGMPSANARPSSQCHSSVQNSDMSDMDNRSFL